jgi:hypothetical protein
MFEAQRMVDGNILEKLLSLPDLLAKLEQLWQLVELERADLNGKIKVS